MSILAMNVKPFWLKPMHAILALMLLCGVVAADSSPSENAIAEAVKLLMAQRDAIEDPVEKARIEKAIRQLESLVDDARPAPSNANDINHETLKKKFAGKAIYDPKSGELTLKYDFPGKAQLGDFVVDDKRVMVAKKTLAVEAGDDLLHIAKFKSFQVSAVMTFKSMNGPGLKTTAGTGIRTGGTFNESIFLTAAGGETAKKSVPKNLRQGSVPVQLDVSPHKVSVRYGGSEVLTVPNAHPNDTHQILLSGGPDGCGFSNLVIVGIPDPMWFKEFLAE